MTRSRTMRRAEALRAAAPEVAEAQSALARFRRGRRLTADGKLPGTGEPFRWRLLSGAEEDEAIAEAVARMATLKIPVELRAYSDLEEVLTWEILAIAMRDPAVEEHRGEPYPRPFAADALELRDLLSTTEREILFADYADFAESVDPDPVDIEPAVLAAIDDALKKKQSANLIAFGSRALASYLLTTVSQPSS